MRLPEGRAIGLFYSQAATLVLVKRFVPSGAQDMPFDIPESVAEILSEAPRNCWLILDVVRMRIEGSFDDSVVAIQQAAAKGSGYLVVWSGPGEFEVPPQVRAA